MLTVTIGIPAYNEEANIENLLKVISKQRELEFKIEKIIIVSDCSTDKTDLKIQSFHDQRIIFIRNKLRMGQNYSQNLIFRKSDTDLVIILEADTQPHSSNYILNLITPFFKDHSLGYVQGDEMLLLPNTNFEATLYAQFQIFHDAYVRDSYLKNWLSSGRGGRAFSKNLYKNMNWPENVPEDVYVMLWCKTRKIKTCFQNNAFCLYRGPQNIVDYIKSSQKLKSGQISLKKYFIPEYIEHAYHRSLLLRIKIAVLFLVKNPLTFFKYMLIHIQIKRFLKNETFSDIWSTAQSTKLL